LQNERTLETFLIQILENGFSLEVASF